VKHAWVVSDGLTGERLDRALAALAAAAGVALSRRRARALLEQGAVWVEGRLVRAASRVVTAGQRIEVVVEDLAGEDQPAALEPSRILYEDEALIAVDKPAGLPTQATATGARDTLLAALERLITAREGRRPYLALHHRLDRDTSGVIVLARDPRANAGLAAAFRERQAHKVYLALTLPGDPAAPPEQTIDAALRPTTEGHARRQRVDPTGDPARTLVRRLAVSPLAWWVEAQPLTGRMHQIRAHLAHAGTPLLGDRLYGGPQEIAGHPVPRTMLHAARLTLPHPLTGALLTLDAPLPADLRALRDRLLPSGRSSSSRE